VIAAAKMRKKCDDETVKAARVIALLMMKWLFVSSVAAGTEK
jgi:hypothetical protein